MLPESPKSPQIISFKNHYGNYVKDSVTEAQIGDLNKQAGLWWQELEVIPKTSILAAYYANRLQALETLTQVIDGIDGIPNRMAVGTFMSKLLKIFVGEFRIDEIPESISVVELLGRVGFYEGLMVGIKILNLPEDLLGYPENIQENLTNALKSVTIGPIGNLDFSRD